MATTFNKLAYDSRRPTQHSLVLSRVEWRIGGRGSAVRRHGMACHTAIAKVEIDGQNFCCAVLFVPDRKSKEGKKEREREKEGVEGRGEGRQGRQEAATQHSAPLPANARVSGRKCSF